MPITDIVPYENNPRLNEGAIEYVMNSIKEFGFKQPIVVDKDNVIIVGHTRYKAAQRLSLKEVPVLVATDLSPAQVKAYRIADNKTAEKALWDDDLLGVELQDIGDIFNMEDFGFGGFELMSLTEDVSPHVYSKEVEDRFEDGEDTDEYLMRQRLIITFDPKDKEALFNLLGIEISDKVVWRYEELNSAQRQ